MKKVLFLSALLLCAVSPGLAQEARIRFTATDKNQNPALDLVKEDLSLHDGKTALTITGLERVHNKPLAVTLMLDNSISQEKVFPISKVFAGRIIRDILEKTDLISIVSFSNKVIEVQSLTVNRQDAASAILKLQVDIPTGLIPGTGGIVTGKRPTLGHSPSGSTGIWDAVASAGTKSDAKSDGHRKIVILITDGVNTAGTKKLDDAIQELNKAGIVVYSIGIGDSYEYQGVEKKELEKLSELTGGRSFSVEFANEKDFSEAEKKITSMLGNLKQSLLSEYLLTFTAPPQIDKGSKLKLTITNSQKKNHDLAYPREY